MDGMGWMDLRVGGGIEHLTVLIKIEKCSDETYDEKAHFIIRKHTEKLGKVPQARHNADFLYQSEEHFI